MIIRYGVYGILVHEGAVLMVQTRSGGLDIWNFPGGGIDAGETPLQALVRECHEELGVAVTVHEKLYANNYFIHPILGSKNVMTYYRITLVDNERIDYQLESARWFELDVLPLDAMLSVDQEMARLVMRNSDNKYNYERHNNIKR